MKQATMEAPGKIRFDNVPEVPLAKGEVRIRIRQIGICGSDIHVWHGTHPFTPYPVIQGHEFMGVVDAIGPEVKGAPAIGSKVTARPQIVCGHCNPCRKGRYNICDTLKVAGFQADGCGREFYNVPADLLVPLPDDFTGEQGAFVEPVAVAVHACSRAGDLRGRNVVVLGSGTIGNLIAQVAKARRRRGSRHRRFRPSAGSGEAVRHRARHQHHGAVAQGGLQGHLRLGWLRHRPGSRRR